MAWPPTNTDRVGIIGALPARTIRCSVAMLLRMGIGLSMVSSGLAGYFNAQRPGSNINAWGQNVSIVWLDPYLAVLPYLSIVLGVALILGFLTSIAAIAAGFFSLLGPIIEIVQILARGPMNNFNGIGMGMGMGNDPMLAMMVLTAMPQLLNYAILIWLSPLENHPFSIDALVFGRNEIAPMPRATVQPGGMLEEPATTDAVVAD